MISIQVVRLADKTLIHLPALVYNFNGLTLSLSTQYRWHLLLGQQQIKRKKRRNREREKKREGKEGRKERRKEKS